MPLSDVAILLGIGRAAAYKAYHSGEIECVRVGRRILVITAALRKKLGVNDE